MRILIVYYSKTGRTRRVAKIIKEKLEENGNEVCAHEVKERKDYAKYLLHLNPRLIYDTLIRKRTEIKHIKINLRDYDLLILGSPIWYGTVVPAIRAIIEKFKGIKINTICFTTSDLDRGYSKKFRRLLEGLGYKVIYNFDVVKKESEKEHILRIKEVIKSSQL